MNSNATLSSSTNTTTTIPLIVTSRTTNNNNSNFSVPRNVKRLTAPNHTSSPIPEINDDMSHLFRCVYISEKAKSGIIIFFCSWIPVICFVIVLALDAAGVFKNKTTKDSSISTTSSSTSSLSLPQLVSIICLGLYLVPWFILMRNGARLLGENKVSIIVFNFDLELAVFRTDVNLVEYCCKYLVNAHLNLGLSHTTSRRFRNNNNNNNGEAGGDENNTDANNSNTDPCKIVSFENLGDLHLAQVRRSRDRENDGNLLPSCSEMKKTLMSYLCPCCRNEDEMNNNDNREQEQEEADPYIFFQVYFLCTTAQQITSSGNNGQQGSHCWIPVGEEIGVGNDETARNLFRNWKCWYDMKRRIQVMRRDGLRITTATIETDNNSNNTTDYYSAPRQQQQQPNPFLNNSNNNQAAVVAELISHASTSTSIEQAHYFDHNDTAGNNTNTIGSRSSRVSSHADVWSRLTAGGGGGASSRGDDNDDDDAVNERQNVDSDDDEHIEMVLSARSNRSNRSSHGSVRTRVSSLPPLGYRRTPPTTSRGSAQHHRIDGTSFPSHSPSPVDHREIGSRKDTIKVNPIRVQSPLLLITSEDEDDHGAVQGTVIVNVVQDDNVDDLWDSL